MGLCEREMIELRDDGLDAGLPGDRGVLRYDEDIIFRRLPVENVKTRINNERWEM